MYKSFFILPIVITLVFTGITNIDIKAIVTTDNKSNKTLSINNLLYSDISCESVISDSGVTYQFPTISPARVDIGLKDVASSIVNWQDITNTPPPSLQMTDSKTLLAKVTNDFQYAALQSRMLQCPASSDFFNEVLQEEIDFTKDYELTKIMDEQTLWSKYVNWLSARAPQTVQRNSGKVFITLEIWNLDTMKEITNGDCSLQSLPSQRQGLLFRLSQQYKTFSISTQESTADYGLFPSNFSAIGDYYIRVKHCYTLSVFDYTSTQYRRISLCSKWTRGPMDPNPLPPNYKPMSKNATIKTFELLPVRIRISRPKSYNNTTDKTCVNESSLIYYPPFKATVTNPSNFTPPSADDDINIEYESEDKRRHPKYYGSVVFNTEDPYYYKSSRDYMDVVHTNLIGSSVEKDSNGCVFINAEAYEKLFMRRDRSCVQSCGCENPSPGSYLEKFSEDEVDNFERIIIKTTSQGADCNTVMFKRNGIWMVFDENTKYATIRVPRYKAFDLKGQMGDYPRYFATEAEKILFGTGDPSYVWPACIFYRPLAKSSLPFYDSETYKFYVPIVPLATGLGATMAYDKWDNYKNKWDINTKNEYILKPILSSMIANDYADKDKGAVFAAVWDQRIWRNGAISGSLQNINPSVAKAFPIHSKYLSLEYSDVALICQKEIKGNTSPPPVIIPPVFSLKTIGDCPERFKISPNFSFDDVACGGTTPYHLKVKFVKMKDVTNKDVPNEVLTGSNAPRNARILTCVSPWGGVPDAMQSVLRKVYEYGLKDQNINYTDLVYVSCSFRCPVCNSHVDGVSYSSHMLGRCADLSLNENQLLIFKAGAAVLLDCNIENVESKTTPTAYNYTFKLQDNRQYGLKNGNQIFSDAISYHMCDGQASTRCVPHPFHTTEDVTPRRKCIRNGSISNGSLSGLEGMPFGQQYWTHIFVYPYKGEWGVGEASGQDPDYYCEGENQWP